MKRLAFIAGVALGALGMGIGLYVGSLLAGR